MANATKNEFLSISDIVFIALFAALTAVGSYIAIPIGPVPIVLQNLFILLAGLILGPVKGLIMVVIYLMAGAIGLPIFAGGKGGFVHFIGPTGGYLLSYIPAVFVAGLISQLGERNIWKDLFGAIAASIVVYAIGVPWLKYMTSMDWSKAIAAGMTPFIIGDILKIAAAGLIAQTIRSVLPKEQSH